MTAIQALKEKVAALAEKMGLTAETVTVEPAAVEAAPAPEAVTTPEVVTEPVATVDGDADHGSEVKTDEAPAAEGEKAAEVVAEADPLAELAEKFTALEAKYNEALASAASTIKADLEKEFDERVAKAAAQKLASATAQPLPVTPGEANEKGEISKPKLKGAAAVAAALKARRGA